MTKKNPEDSIATNPSPPTIAQVESQPNVSPVSDTSPPKREPIEKIGELTIENF